MFGWLCATAKLAATANLNEEKVSSRTENLPFGCKSSNVTRELSKYNAKRAGYFPARLSLQSLEITR